MAISRWTCVSRYKNVSILDFIGAKGDGGGSSNWSYMTCKAPVNNVTTNKPTPSFYRPDALPVTQPTESKHWRENFFILTNGNNHSSCYTNLTHNCFYL